MEGHDGYADTFGRVSGNGEGHTQKGNGQEAFGAHGLHHCQAERENGTSQNGTSVHRKREQGERNISPFT